MIKKFLLLTLTTVVMFSSCAKVAETTQIEGVVVPEGFDQVQVALGNQLDTLVAITEGKFSLSVPTDVCQLGTISVGQYVVYFIPDGTTLKVTLDEESSVVSDSPKISVQEQLNTYLKSEENFVEEFRNRQMEIVEDVSLSDEEKGAKWAEFSEPFFQKYLDFNETTFESNTQNFISLFALQNIRSEISDEKMDSLLNRLAPSLQENDVVKSMRKALTIRLQTSEGKMFTDFTVNSVVGMTRSIPPQPVYGEVKLSDYVGKGKYVLLDFWSPWCGPCKREIPNIKAVYEKYSGKGLEVVSIAVWEREPVQVTIDTAAQLGMDWPQINNAGTEPATLYGVEAIPHLILFGPNGTILKRGFHGLDGISAAVGEYLD